jgi:hypothetical protein
MTRLKFLLKLIGFLLVPLLAYYATTISESTPEGPVSNTKLDVWDALHGGPRGGKIGEGRGH